VVYLCCGEENRRKNVQEREKEKLEIYLGKSDLMEAKEKEFW